MKITLEVGGIDNTPRSCFLGASICDSSGCGRTILTINAFIFMKAKKRLLGRGIFFLFAIIFVFYVGMKVVSGIMDAQNSNAELYPFTHSFPPEDSSLFAKKYLNKIDVDEIAHMSGRGPISLFTFEKKEEIIVYRIDLLKDTGLSNVLNLSRKSSSETVRMSYMPVKFDNFTFECHVAQLLPVHRIFISFSGELIGRIENDTVLSVQSKSRNFSVKYTEEGPVDILIEGRLHLPFFQASVPMNLLLLRRGTAVFLFLMAPLDGRSSLDPGLLYNIVMGT